MNLALDWFLVGAACGSLLTLVATLVGRRSRNRKNARTRTACLDGLAAIAAARRRKEQGEV